jgi:hypothetical protein
MRVTVRLCGSCDINPTVSILKMDGAGRQYWVERVSSSPPPTLCHSTIDNIGDQVARNRFESYVMTIHYNLFCCTWEHLATLASSSDGIAYSGN